jgi:hypothetical protein
MSMNRLDRADILAGLLQDLKDNKTDTFELYPEEIEVVLYLLENWDKRRKYFKDRYKIDRDHRIEEGKRRYREKKRRLLSG